MSQGLVTVFGGSGFIGRYVVQRLARAGWQVRIAVRRPDEALFLKTAGDVGQVTPIAANIRDDTSVAAAVAGADAVVNLVGILAEGGPQRFDTVQAKGAARIAAAAKAAGAKRLIQISAIGANPQSEARYARSKAEGEEAAKRAFPDVTILRPSIVFGPEDDFFNRFARMALMSPALPLIGGGHTKFQPVYVGDLAAAVERTLGDPATMGKTYELGGPRTYTFRALMEMLLKGIGRCRLLVPLPFAIATIKAAFLQLLPVKLLTVDQVRLLRHDNVVGANAAGFKELGLIPTPLESILPTYLDQYRPSGFYNKG
ncbi:complex I NDUFA9 subunit family protein [Dongia sp.]|uniref:complex I NDUFA9 subunit family protein n=1 Tax=Dongia sp. TaxID=1977262 RepID=UPI0035B32474